VDHANFLQPRVQYSVPGNVGEGCITINSQTVGAGPVVSQDVPDGVTVVGNPQRIIDWKCTCHD